MIAAALRHLSHLPLSEKSSASVEEGRKGITIPVYLVIELLILGLIIAFIAIGLVPFFPPIQAFIEKLGGAVECIRDLWKCIHF